MKTQGEVISVDIKRKTEYTYMEILRVLCAYAVVVIHVSGANWFQLKVGDPNWNVQTFYNVGARFANCVFCMISGALLLRPNKNIGIRDVFGRYVKRILICFVAWMVLYSALYTIMEHGNVNYFILHLFKLPVHFWYLLMLMGLYLALPILKAVTADKKLTLYLIWLLVIFGVVFGTIQGVTGLFSNTAGDSMGYYLWKSILDDVNELNRTFVPGYLGFFLLGHYVHEYGLGKWSRLFVIMAIPSLLLSAVLTILFSMGTDSYVYAFMMETNPMLAVAAVGIFEFFKGQKGKERVYDVNSRCIKGILFLSGNTFGIYLSHLAGLKILEVCFGFNVASYPAILSVPLNSLLVFIMALGITVVLKQIPLVKKTVT